MSEVSVVPAAPAAPEAAPAVAPQSAPGGAPNVFQGRAALKQNVIVEPSTPTPEQPRDDGGRYASPNPETPPVEAEPVATGEVETGEQATGEAPVVEDPAAQAAGEGEAKAEATATPEGFTELEVPEWHPYRERGHERIIVPEGLENEYRSFLNDPIRRSERDQAISERAEARKEAAGWQEAAKLFAAETHRLMGDVAFAQKVEDIRATAGDDVADAFVSRELNAIQDRVMEGVEKATTQYTEAQAAEAAQKFGDTARMHLTRSYPHFTLGEQVRLIQSFGNFVANDPTFDHREPTLSDFIPYADHIYANHPKVKAARQEQDAKRQSAIEAEAERKAAAAAEAAVREHQTHKATNPMGRIPNVQTGRQTMDPVVQEAPLNIFEAKKNLRRGIATSMGR